MTYDPTSGIFAPLENGHGGSDHYTWVPGMDFMGGFIYWDEAHGNLVYLDYTVSATPIDDPGTPTRDLVNYECLFMSTYSTTDVHVLFRDKSILGNYYLYNIDPYDRSVRWVKTLTSAVKLTQSTIIAANEKNAKYLYFVHDNEVWLHDLTDGTESQISMPEEIDGEITYISHRHYDHSYATPFNYFAIATFKNGNYTLSMFTMTGGLPSGTPALKITGQGKVKETHFLAPDYFWYDAMEGKTYSH
jgi:hypothetical protein